MINQQQLQVAITQNQFVPTEGPRVVPIPLDFTATQQQLLDATLLQDRNFLSMLQTIFVDMSNAAAVLRIAINGTGQVIHCKPNTQGYYTVLCPNPIRIEFDASATGDTIPIFLINVPIPGVVWPTV